MKLITIICARKVIEGFADKEDLSAHLAYWMTKFIAKTEGDYEFYKQETKKLYDKYSEVNSEGKYFVPADKVSAFRADADNLDSTEAEDPGIRFDLSELSAELKLSMRQMYPLLDFINEDK